MEKAIFSMRKSKANIIRVSVYKGVKMFEARTVDYSTFHP